MTAFADLVDTHQHATIDATVKAIVQALDLNETQRVALEPLIHDGVRRLWRNDARCVEAAIRDGTPVDPAGNRSDWLSSRFALPDGRYVSWGEATVADHQARIRFLTSLRDGLDATIRRHQSVIVRLEAAKVDRLNDLPDVSKQDVA